MQIAATTVSMDAARTYKEVDQRFTGLSMGPPAAGSGQTDLFGIRLATMLASTTQTTLSCRSEVSRADGEGATLAACGTNPGAETTLGQLAQQVIGQPVRIGAVESDPSPSPSPGSPAPATSPLLAVRTASLISGVVYRQEESLLFSAQGTVRTTDGREIDFDLGLSLERRTVAAATVALEVSTLFVDPLILQFDVDAPLLGNSTFLFDLDSDGTEENLACPGGGCGFLALDRNHDGRIDSGRELFGPASGSGFGELADLDSDTNRWIDESDPAFDQLLVWRPDGEGGESLLSLRQAGVGAIAVTHAGTGFQLQGADGTILGTIAASGIFLTEDGEVRPLQEVDLALEGTAATSGPSEEEGADRELEAALLGLRGIVAMQQLRLRLLLTGERLRRAMAEQREDQHQFLFDWLHARSDWQARIEGGPGADAESKPAAWTLGHGRRDEPDAAAANG